MWQLSRSGRTGCACIVFTICNSLGDDAAAFMLSGITHILNLKFRMTGNQHSANAQRPASIMLTNRVKLKSRHVCGNWSSRGGEYATQPIPNTLPEGSELMTFLLGGSGGANHCTCHP